MDKIEEINSIYRKLQKEISDILFSEQKNKLIKISKLSLSAVDETKKWADKYVDKDFMSSYLSTINKLKQLGLEKKRTAQKLKFIKQRQTGLYRRFEYIHNSIMFFVSEFIDQFMKTEKFIETEIQSYSNPVAFRSTVLGNETKKEVRKGLNVLKRFTKTGYLYRATLSRGEIEKNLKKMFKGMFGDIDFIAIQMKNGRIRRYQLKTYVNMLARTEMRYISTQAAKLALQEWEHDLVRVVPEFVGTCPSGICLNYVGQVFSLSGKNKDYPVLDEEPPFHPYCYCKDTEIYTIDGWKKIKDAKIGEFALSLIINNKIIEYAKINNTFKIYSSKMINFKNKISDILVTPNHKMLYENDWSSKNGYGDLKFIEAEKLLNKKSGRFYASSEWVGSDDLDIDFVRFMAIWLSDGSVQPKEKGNRIIVSQSRNKSTEKYNLFNALIKRYFKTNVYEGKNGVSFCDKNMAEYLRKFGYSYEKYVPDEIKKSSMRLIKEFLLYFSLCDGYIREKRTYKGHEFNNEIVYHTSSNKMASDLGELLIKAGRRPSYHLNKCKGNRIKFRNGNYEINHDVWTIRQCNNQYISMQNMKTEIIDYNDYAYCVELEKNHTLLTRRNGKVVWSGNCIHSITPVTPESIALDKEREKAA